MTFGALAHTIQHLRNSGVIAMPTDTQYALSAIANDDDAVSRIFQLKQRPAGENLPVFLPPDRWRDHLAQIAEPLDPRLHNLADAAWPGPLTLILPKRGDWPTRAVQGDTIAFRIPDHPVAVAVLDQLDAPLTGTSANIHGRPAAVTVDDVRLQFGEDSETLHIVDDGGIVPAGAASTILDCTDSTPRILRRGPSLSARVSELLLEHWGIADLDSA